jgi:hypothetical protein
MRRANNSIQRILRIIATPFALAIIIVLVSVGQLSVTTDVAIGQVPQMAVNQEMAVLCAIMALAIGVAAFCKRHAKDRDLKLEYTVDNEDVEI